MSYRNKYMDRGAKFNVGGPDACKASVMWQQGPGDVSADITFHTDEGNYMIYECLCSL